MVRKKYIHSPVSKYKEHMDLYEKKLKGNKNNKYSFSFGIKNTNTNIIMIFVLYFILLSLCFYLIKPRILYNKKYIKNETDKKEYIYTLSYPKIILWYILFIIPVLIIFFV